MARIDSELFGLYTIYSFFVLVDKRSRRMNPSVGNIIAALLAALLAMLYLFLKDIVRNQKLQIKQKYASDMMTLVSLVGDGGFTKIKTSQTLEGLSTKEKYIAGLIVQHAIAAKRIRSMFNDEEWFLLQKDIMEVMKWVAVGLMWREAEQYYDWEISEWMNKMIFSKVGEYEHGQNWPENRS